MVGGPLLENLEHHGLEDGVDLVGKPLLVVLARVSVLALHLFGNIEYAKQRRGLTRHRQDAPGSHGRSAHMGLNTVALEFSWEEEPGMGAGIGGGIGRDCW